MLRTRFLLAALAAGCITHAQAQAQTRIPPQPHCLDARAVAEMRQPGPASLAVRTGDGQHYRLGLGSDCPGVDQAESASLLAAEGWVCGGPREFVNVDGQLCPISQVAAIDAAGYAALLRASAREGVTTLGPVQVRGERRRGFGGSYSYCFAPRHLRAWSEDADGLIVEVSPRHSGGNRYYRVELAANCPELHAAPALQFESGMGLGLICGNPGDKVVARDERTVRSGPGTRIPCTVTAVYPRPAD